jgi:diketogulonate reductase-like aldo/keto reductase
MNNGYAHAKKAIDRSIKECGLDYIDLYLIHGPIGGPKARRESWKAICEAQEEGKLKSIGISNFGIRHMEEMARGGVTMPVVNQASAIYLSRTPGC